MAEYSGYWGMGIMMPSAGPLISRRRMVCTPLLAPSVRKMASGSTADVVTLQDELGHGLADEPHAPAFAVGAQPYFVPARMALAASITSGGKDPGSQLHEGRILAEGQDLPVPGERPLPQGLGVADVAVDDLAALLLQLRGPGHDGAAHGVFGIAVRPCQIGQSDGHGYSNP